MQLDIDRSWIARRIRSYKREVRQFLLQRFRPYTPILNHLVVS